MACGECIRRKAGLKFASIYVARVTRQAYRARLSKGRCVDAQGQASGQGHLQCVIALDLRRHRAQGAHAPVRCRAGHSAGLQDTGLAMHGTLAKTRTSLNQPTPMPWWTCAGAALNAAWIPAAPAS